MSVVCGPTLKLSNGVEMPQVGLGTWQSSTEEVKAAVHAAIDAGYRLIDTAWGYGNEDAIGAAVKEAIDAGKVKREDLFITTKAWVVGLHPNKIEAHIRDSLKKLQLDYVDLYLAHMPTAFDGDMTKQDHSVTVEDIWRGLETLYNKKLTRAIGVSNWSLEQVARALKIAKVPMHNVQVELYLYFPQHELHQFCKKHHISMTSYATMGSPGRVNDNILPTGETIEWAPCPNPMEDPNVVALARKYGKAPEHVLLRYAMDRGLAIIPKSKSPQRIRSNFQLFDFKLTPEDIKLLESSPHRQRLFFQFFMEGHPEDAFASERKPKSSKEEATKCRTGPQDLHHVSHPQMA